MQTFSKSEAESGMLENMKHIGERKDKYFEWNLSKFPYEKKKRILDLGCGPCTYFNSIMNLEPLFYCATDFSDVFLKEVCILINGKENCVTENIDLLDENSIEKLMVHKFDIIMCFDVIEHIEDDLKAFRNIAEILKKTGRGKLFVKVPAIQSLYGVNDFTVGHYRRYSKKSLANALEQSGFKILQIRYHNIFGVIPWLIIGRVLKRKIALSNSERSIFDVLVPVFRFIENIIPPPIGLSLNCTCELK
jgi:SAM-dependent methyltransferase